MAKNHRSELQVKTAEYCAHHAPGGIADVRNRKCRTQGCGKGPLFGVADTETVEYCAQHAPDKMVKVCKKYRTEGCNKVPSFGVGGKKMRGTVYSTHRTGWSTSRTESAEF